MEQENKQNDLVKNHTIKKIDFKHYLSTYEKIQEMLHDEISIALKQEGIDYVKKLKRNFFITIAISIWATFYYSWIIFIPLYAFSFSYLYRSQTWKKLTPAQIENVTKTLINKEYNKQLNNYRKEVSLINYIPDGLKYEALELITCTGNNYYNAETMLIGKAFKLNADGIINVTLNSTSSTRVSGRTGEKGYITSSIDTTVYLQGMAIKLLN